MPGDDSRSDPTRPPDGGPTRVESIVKLLLGATGLVVLVALLRIVPPLERQVPGAPITFETTIVALVTILVVGLFVVVADELESLVRDRVAGPDELVADVAAAIQYLVIFLVLVAAYRPLARAVTPFLTPGETVWIFDLAFVILVFLPLLAAAALVVQNLDALASRVTDAFRSAGDRLDPGAESAGEPASNGESRSNGESE